MIKLRHCLLIAGLLVVAEFAMGQGALTLYHLMGQPMSEEINPAVHRDSSRLVIGFPLLSGIDINANSDFAYSDLIHYGSGEQSDSLIVDFNTFHDALRNHNSLLQEVSIDYFNFGFWSRRYYFSFHIRDKQLGQSKFDKKLVTFFRDGNANYLGQNYDLGSIGMNFLHYREYAVGVSKDLDERFTVGGTLKMLFGKSNLLMNKLKLDVESGAQGEHLTLRATGDAMISAPVDITFDENGFVDDVDGRLDEFGDYFFNNKNLGFGVDLGVNFKATSKLHLGLSLVDFGFIRWDADLYDLTEEGEFRFEGVDLSQSINENAPGYKPARDAFEDLADSIQSGFRINESRSFYVSQLPKKIYLAGSYFLDGRTSIGLIGRFYQYEGYSDVSATLSANKKIGQSLGVSVSYSMMKRQFDNIGLGMSLRMGAVQLYLASDNVASIIYPSDMQVASLRFGINLLFNRDYKKQRYSRLRADNDLGNNRELVDRFGDKKDQDAVFQK
ncbi:hypothetical protein EYV94_24320 [Puteibacter caeruleilacunae]|nr:hypothetical protein EYV94_24320 [Puteibacter caeruleilacunae]